MVKVQTVKKMMYTTSLIDFGSRLNLNTLNTNAELISLVTFLDLN